MPPPPTGDLPALGVRLMLRHLMLHGWTSELISDDTGIGTFRLGYLRSKRSRTVTRTEAGLIFRFYSEHYDDHGPSTLAVARAISEQYMEMWRVAPKLVPPAHRPILSAAALHAIEVSVRSWLVRVRRTGYWLLLSASQDFYLTHRFVLTMSEADMFLTFFKFHPTDQLLTNSGFAAWFGLDEPRIRWLTSQAILALVSWPAIPIDGHADTLRTYLVALAA